MTTVLQQLLRERSLNTSGQILPATHSEKSVPAHSRIFFPKQIHNNIFIALDWNSRHHAAASLGYKGSMPGADLYDFTGGTFFWLEEQLKQLGFIPIVYSPHFSLVTKVLLDKCHEQKIKIIPWTVNEKTKIDELKAMGVDGVISDYPDLF